MKPLDKTIKYNHYEPSMRRAQELVYIFDQVRRKDEQQ